MLTMGREIWTLYTIENSACIDIKESTKFNKKVLHFNLIIYVILYRAIKEVSYFTVIKKIQMFDVWCFV